LDLVEAIGKLRGRGTELYALMLGDGPLRQAVEGRISVLGLQNHVRLTGFVNQQEIPLVLDAGDILAMTSEVDPHPLSVTESMIVGHAIVASDRIGCVGPTDSARPGVNALVYPVGDIERLAHCLEQLATDRELLLRMATTSKDRAASQDVSVTVSAVLQAIQSLRPKFAGSWSDVDADCLDKLQQGPLLAVT
jgi:glycosyltransferase involved in cell wall biosynthesis